MSVVTNLILCFSSLENEEERLRDVNSFSYRNDGINFVSVDYNKEAGQVWYGGNKYLEGRVYLAVYNHFDTPDFITHLRKIAWEARDLVQLFVKEEQK
jgi:hypothetical protein